MLNGSISTLSLTLFHQIHHQNWPGGIYPLYFISSIIEQAVKLSFLSAYLAKEIHHLSRIIWSMKSIGGAWNTIHCTTRVTEQCDGCGVCDEVCVAVRYVGRIPEG
ncbi:MAG: hypothetical protein HF982_04775 [Desulfobacteraceae bacterium]|nr:hypothetical protein [Desulfobacteraceae bacterium]MBC2718894.1 hypothetical protein [Desulfobacteraceae bacterium]